MRSGRVEVDTGQLGRFGEFGFYWSFTARTDVLAYRLYFDQSKVEPTNESVHYLPFSLRCLAS